MKLFIMTALGGAAGACCRYALTLLPFNTSFPVKTFITNILGAIIIGFAAELFNVYSAPNYLQTFIKTGFCGGFTTFSTFSSESFNLIHNNKIALAITYCLSSLILCIIGVYIGQILARLISKK